MKRIIDLHSHSRLSLDGELTPSQLVDLAITEGVKYYALADHDEVRGVAEAIEHAKDKDITVIPAVELSGYIDKYPLHILGYNIDYNNPLFVERKLEVNRILISTLEKLTQKARDYGFIFEEENLHHYRADGLYCEEQIAEEILKDPRNDNNPFLDQFRPGGKLSDNPSFNFYREFYATGKPGHVDYDFNLFIGEVSKMIHEGGGKMFLAHPAYNIKHDEETLRKIISYRLDGIEVFSSYHNDEDIKFYYEMARKYNLYMSVGSDYHGHSKPSIRMGSIDYDEAELEKTLRFLGVRQ